MIETCISELPRDLSRPVPRSSLPPWLTLHLVLCGVLGVSGESAPGSPTGFSPLISTSEPQWVHSFVPQGSWTGEQPLDFQSTLKVSVSQGPAASLP